MIEKGVISKVSEYVRDSLGRFTSKIIIRRSERVFKTRKTKLLNRLLRHPVSQELRSMSSSSLLGGMGTLYGFMGFDAGTQPDPVGYLYDYLDRNITPVYKQIKGGLAMEVLLKVPSYEEMRSDEDLVLPWDGGVSWPEALEIGVTGLGYFLRGGHREMGRSGWGLQTRKKIRKDKIVRTKYLTEIYKDDTDFRS
jgi:hypothetical protein